MIKELSRELVSLIHKDYPELEDLNLSSNGKFHRLTSFLLSSSIKIHYNANFSAVFVEI